MEFSSQETFRKSLVYIKYKEQKVLQILRNFYWVHQFVHVNPIHIGEEGIFRALKL